MLVSFAEWGTDMADDRPARVRLNGIDWSIEYLTSAELFTAAHMDLLGQCLSSQVKVQVRSDMPESRQQAILWHELVHAVHSDAGIDLSEDQVRALAAGTFAILRDNPELVAFLMRGAHGTDSV
jgi:hypothetical protein